MMSGFLSLHTGASLAFTTNQCCYDEYFNNKYEKEMYMDYMNEHFSLVIVEDDSGANDEFCPCHAVIEDLEGNLWRLDFERYCSYSHMPNRIDNYYSRDTVDWRKVEKKTKTITVYE